MCERGVSVRWRVCKSMCVFVCFGMYVCVRCELGVCMIRYMWYVCLHMCVIAYMCAGVEYMCVCVCTQP